jgi:hypothetical protein
MLDGCSRIRFFLLLWIEFEDLFVATVQRRFSA